MTDVGLEDNFQKSPRIPEHRWAKHTQRIIKTLPTPTPLVAPYFSPSLNLVRLAQYHAIHETNDSTRWTSSSRHDTSVGLAGFLRTLPSLILILFFTSKPLNFYPAGAVLSIHVPTVLGSFFVNCHSSLFFLRLSTPCVQLCTFSCSAMLTLS